MHSDGAKIGVFLITSKFSSCECIENYIFFAESRENSTKIKLFRLIIFFILLFYVNLTELFRRFSLFLKRIMYLCTQIISVLNMSKNIKGICALTKDECELRDSHIYPKFVYNYLKKKGGNRFRTISNPNEVLQDGWKERLLGEYAEQEFSKREKWFAETIFLPFSQGLLSKSKVEYGTELYYFCVSLLWRVLYVTKDSIIGEDFKQKCCQALEEWRVFLNGGCLPPTYNRIYLMPMLPELYDAIPQEHFTPGQWNEIEWYIRRVFDSALYDNIPNNYAFFCKMPFFFFWAVFEKDSVAPNYGLRIMPNGGKIDFKRYHLGDGILKSYILIRIVLGSQIVEEITENMSEAQQNKIIQRTIQDKHLLNSELGYLLLQKAKS